jgi:hypothetical protein
LQIVFAESFFAVGEKMKDSISTFETLERVFLPVVLDGIPEFWKS